MMSENGGFSEGRMDGEDGVRTVDCLRGRLLAERAASRNAKEEASQLGNKLMELENLLKQEAKSRNRAEKKLKSLMKKLESINISHVSDESENSSLVDKSDDSSTTEGSTITAFEDQPSRILGRETAQNECSLISASDEHYEKSSPEMDQQSDICNDSVRYSGYEEVNEEGNDQDPDRQIDNSMALVLVGTPQEDRTVDPEVLDATVKEVLDALRYAKEQLQSSMERRRMNMIRVG